MKKKVLSLALCLALAATAVVGGTLAYFTDTDRADNTFTTAKVEIKLNEQQRNDGHTALEDFENNKVLMPIVASAQDNNETVGGVAGLPKSANYVDKILTITNKAVDSYVRLYIAIPSVLDNVKDAGQNILHFNTTAESAVEGQWGNETLVAKDFAIDGVNYNVYYRTYTTALTKDATTDTPAYVGFYMDKGVDTKEVVVIDENVGRVDGQWSTKTVYTINGETINFDFSNGVTIPVFAVGTQAAGFTSADEAVNTAFGADYNPWAK